jgi:hypothetical protein
VELERRALRLVEAYYGREPGDVGYLGELRDAHRL